jgi:hypothetical protein
VRILYWACSALLAAWLLAGGAADITHTKAAVAILNTLGYPEYLCTILGVSKLLAVVALLHPRTRLLREWAYAGVAFDGLGAFYSHVAVKDAIAPTLAPVVFLAFAAASYLLRPAQYKLISDPR